MGKMDREKIFRLLDKSYADALEVWHRGRRIDRLRALEATKALDRRLGGLVIPDYSSEYIPPAYLIKYQLSHVCLALKTLSCLAIASADSTVGFRKSLRIVDFGAGASSGRIGAALMAAEAIEDNRTIDSIYYDEIDTSAPMQAMGELVWQAFTARVRKGLPHSALARAVEVMNYSQHMDWKKVAKRDCETWLTAFHVTYQDQNRDNLKKIIKAIDQRVRPVAGAFSCYYSKDGVGGGNLSQMKYVFPFDKPNPPCETVSDGSECETAYIAKRAVHYGFYPKLLPPFLSVNSAILFGGSSRKLGAENQNPR